MVKEQDQMLKHVNIKTIEMNKRYQKEEKQYQKKKKKLSPNFKKFVFLLFKNSLKSKKSKNILNKIYYEMLICTFVYFFKFKYRPRLLYKKLKTNKLIITFLAYKLNLNFISSFYKFLVTQDFYEIIYKRIFSNYNLNSFFIKPISTTDFFANGYFWVSLNFMQYFFFFFKKYQEQLAYVIISRQNRNTFITITSINGFILNKISTGAFVSKDPTKGKKKKLAYTGVQAGRNLHFNFVRNNKIRNLTFKKYFLKVKKSTKYFNYKSLVYVFLNQNIIPIEALKRVSKKPFGFGCKLKRQKRKRSKRFKRRTR